MAGVPLSKDQILEVLICSYLSGHKVSQFIGEIIDRTPTIEDVGEFHRACLTMRNGWIQMNKNIRQLGKRK